MLKTQGARVYYDLLGEVRLDLASWVVGGLEYVSRSGHVAAAPWQSYHLLIPLKGVGSS